MTLPPGWARVPLSRRVLPKIGPADERGCREWTGKRSSAGYGRLNYQGKGIQAHRARYELEYGPVPVSMDVCHRCDNPPCCELTHLFVGTRAENLADMRQKGRAAIHERHGGAKLTAVKVAEIRALWRVGDRTYASLGREYGVTWANIRAIVFGKTWRAT